MKLHYAYRFCNIGGVSSVIRERMAADQDSAFQVSCNFEIDGGGFAQLTGAGADVTINRRHLETTIDCLDKIKPDAVHLIDEPDNLPAIREVYSGTLVLEVHSSTPTYLSKVTATSAACADLILVPSKWSRHQLEMRIADSSLRSRIQVLPNIALKPEQADGKTTGRLIEPDLPHILWIGKVSDGKNWRDALRIFASISAFHDCRLVMITGGMIESDKQADVVSEIMALGIEDRVDWRHNLRRQSISAIYSACAKSGGCLLVTSLAESFGLVVIEALAHGLPVVTSNSGALPELISDGKNGAIFPVGSVDKPIAILTDILNGRLKFNPDEVHESVPRDCLAERNLNLLQAMLAECRTRELGPSLLELRETKVHEFPKSLPW